jgi:hypothetical protein
MYNLALVSSVEEHWNPIKVIPNNNAIIRKNFELFIFSPSKKYE